MWISQRPPARSYQVVHADTVDERGIDVAFLFDPTFFTAPADQRFQHVVMRRTATREIVQVNFQTHRDRTWAIVALPTQRIAGGTGSGGAPSIDRATPWRPACAVERARDLTIEVSNATDREVPGA